MSTLGKAPCSATEIVRYARAAPEVAQISQNCLYEISQTMNKKEARTIQEAAIAEVEIIMKNQGLTRAAYNRTSLAMRSDALLSDRINILIKQFG